MNTLGKRGGLVAKILLDDQNPQWVVFSTGNCGILARALIGRHEAKDRESQSIALEFAYRVMRMVNVSFAHGRVSTPQILIDAADEVVDDPEHVALLCTTWRCLPEGIEICSVGSHSVLLFEQDTVREALIPHTVSELVRSQGHVPNPIHRMNVTHVLGSRKSQKRCRIEDIRIALIPPSTTIAIIEERLVADAILEHPLLGSQLPSFLEAWNPPGKKSLPALFFRGKEK